MLEGLFYEAFDNIEVLPASLCEEHRRCWLEDPILAGELTVPVSWRRFSLMRRKGLVTAGENNGPPVVRADYDAKAGLVV
jgi:hypothetical protein